MQLQQSILKSDQIDKTKERLALYALQKHRQMIMVKEMAFLMVFTFGSSMLRVPFQWIPSVEPLTFFAILSGWLFGSTRGFMVGASSLYLSNFLVFGGQGPWTVFQAIGFGAAGFLGGQLRRKARWWEIGVVTLVATLVFEALVNIGSLTFLPFPLFSLFITALPFTAIHLMSNIIFSFFIKPARDLSAKIGGLDERRVVAELMERYKNKLGIRRQ